MNLNLRIDPVSIDECLTFDRIAGRQEGRTSEHEDQLKAVRQEKEGRKSKGKR